MMVLSRWGNHAHRLLDDLSINQILIKIRAPQQKQNKFQLLNMFRSKVVIIHHLIDRRGFFIHHKSFNFKRNDGNQFLLKLYFMTEKLSHFMEVNTRYCLFKYIPKGFFELKKWNIIKNFNICKQFWCKIADCIFWIFQWNSEFVFVVVPKFSVIKRIESKINVFSNFKSSINKKKIYIVVW